MAPKHESTAPKLELFCKLEAERVPFIAKANIPTSFGKFAVYGFLEHKTGKEHLAIVAGEIDSRKRVPVRIHSECWTGDVLGSLKCDCRQQLEAALRHISEHGGMVLYLRQEGRGIGLLNKLKAYALQEQGMDTVEANHFLGFPDDLRTYDCAVEMLSFFGIKKVKLLTNNPKKIGALEKAGIDVDREHHQLESNPHNLRYLKTKAKKSGHLLDFKEEKL
jgi:GTP cyclohydrolase II